MPINKLIEVVLQVRFPLPRCVNSQDQSAQLVKEERHLPQLVHSKYTMAVVAIDMVFSCT